MSQTKVYINGQSIPKEEASLSIYDHGFLYGDGVFEGIRAYNGKVFKLDEHLDRLYGSAHAIMIEMPIPKPELRSAILGLLRDNGLQSAYIRVSVSRGVGLGLDPKNIHNPTVIVMTDSLSLYPQSMYTDGLIVSTVPTRIPPPHVIDPRIKSLGKYLNNIQAKLEANRVGAGEGLMLTVDGYVAEATGDNIFLIRGDKLITPPPYIGILMGITRNTVIDLARRAGIEVVESVFTLYDVYTADECFLTGTAAEVIPVAEVDGRKIGDGKPGTITRQLMADFRKETETVGVAY
ncbi:MAG: branched-chain-amino-acid transaminase [Armatimonadetes bacterium]|nr:branched-chain-amino-acid transaminase [Armatimonadota bacterium]